VCTDAEVLPAFRFAVSSASGVVVLNVPASMVTMPATIELLSTAGHVHV
jgi:hypothetical protein